MNQKQWTIFLDLEETLIESWSDRTLLLGKVNAIQRFIKTSIPRLDMPKFGLMSWAVWNDTDKTEFQQEIQPWLEEQMRITFDQELILSMDEWTTLVRRNTVLKLARQDLFDFGKESLLFWLRNATKDFPDGEIALIDDAVEHNNVIQTNSRKITIINVDKL